MSGHGHDDDHEPDGRVTDSEGTVFPAMTKDGEHPDYLALAGQAPFDKPETEYSEVERRAELFKFIQQKGHPKNMEQSQSTLGDRYGVSQQMISKDMQVIKEYVAKHDTQRAKSVVGWLTEKTVGKHIEAAERLEEAGRLDDAAEMFEQALDVQMDYVDYLMDTGDMDSASEEIEVSGDPSTAYMEMLKQMGDSDE